MDQDVKLSNDIIQKLSEYHASKGRVCLITICYADKDKIFDKTVKSQIMYSSREAPFEWCFQMTDELNRGLRKQIYEKVEPPKPWMEEDI